MIGIFILMVALPPEVHRIAEAMDWLGRPEVATVQTGPRLPGYGLNPALLGTMNGLMPESKGPPYIIGDTPNETLKVTGSWEWDGDIYIVSNGVLLVQGGTITVHGSIYVQDQGKYLLYDGTARYPQMMTYQWGTTLTDNAFMEVRRSTFDYNNLPYGLSAGGNVYVIWDTVTTRGWTTAGCWGMPTVGLRKVNVAGEWLFADSAFAVFKDVDTMLAWFFYGQGAVIDFTFPAWQNINVFEMKDGIPGVSGIDYQVRIDTTDYCMWGTILMPGCDVTFHDSPMRTIGIMGLGTDSQNVSGLVNGMSYVDFTLGMTDRNLHLLNTSVMTWSLYPSDSFKLTFDHCIVGEVLTLGHSFAWGQSYFLDGTGGHFEATEGSINVALYSSMTCEVFTTKSGIAFLAFVGIPIAYGGIWARNTSRLILVECQFPSEPVAYDSGLVYILGVDEPYYAGTESYVPIIGSARINEGPLALTHFDHYNIYWAPVEDTTTWNPLDNPHDYEVKRDTLAVWDTHGLSFGTYLIKLVLWDDAPDSLSMMDVITLNYEDVHEGPRIEKTDLRVIPGRASARLVFNLAQESSVRLSVYDIAGKLVDRPQEGYMAPGKYELRFIGKPGVYIARLETEGKTLNRSFILR
jgi:hypothetical protein